MKHNYGDPKRGLSFEYFNFYQSLGSLGHEVELFDFFEIHRSFGAEEMHRQLRERVQIFQPDLAFFSLYTDQFIESELDKLKQLTATLCFFHDDTWREEFSRHWARHFTYFTTPDIYGVLKYRAIGLNNVLFFPFGCDTSTYKKLAGEKKYDVSFVGSWHPYREWLVKKIREAGISVHVRGYGWKEGIVEQKEMIEIFNQSRINLNLSNTSSWDMRYLLSSPRGVWNSVRSPKSIEQIKARHFEINACGSLQLTYYVEGLERFYKIGEEISIYLSVDDLIRKIRALLSDNKRREEISESGYQRAVLEHSYKKRFEAVFRDMGLDENFSVE